MKMKLRAPSPAMTVACISLTIALSGASYAAIVLPKNSVGTKQIRNNAVKSSKIAANQVTGADVNEATLGQVPSSASADSAGNAATAGMLDGIDSTGFLQNGADAGGRLAGTYPNPTIPANSLSGADINESTLQQVPTAGFATNASTASFATNASTASTANNATSLGGVPASGYQRRCQTGSVRAFARVKGSSTLPAFPNETADPTYIDQVFNCTGDSITVYRSGPGVYTVDLNTSLSEFGLPAMAVVSVIEGSGASGTGTDDFATVRSWGTFSSPPSVAGQPTPDRWVVQVRDADGGAEDAWFNIVIF